MSTPSATSTEGTRAAWPFAAAIVGLSAWAYLPAMRGTWLWDDWPEIVSNTVVRSPGGWWRCWTGEGSMDYFPVKTLLQWAQWHLWGDRVLGYHVVSLLLHAAAALLLARVFRRLGVRLAWLGAALFAFHPVAVESVAWIAEFKNPLSLVLLLLSLECWLAAEERRFDCHRGAESGKLEAGTDPGERRTPSRGSFPASSFQIAAFVLFSLALLSKSTVVMFPCFLLLLAWWRRGRIGRADVSATLPHFVLSAAAGVTTLWFQSHRAVGIAGTPMGLGARATQAGWSVAHYAWAILAPAHPQPMYGPMPSPVAGILAWAGIAAVGCLLGSLRRHPARRSAILGSGWFLLNLFPVLGLIPMSYLRVAPGADHLAYLSLAGAAGLAAAGASKLERMGGWWVRVAGVAACAGLLVLSRAHAAHFSDEERLWTYALERNPDSWLAHANLGSVYLDSNRPRDALVHLEMAARLRPDSPENHINLGNACEGLGLFEDARREFARALAIDPGSAGAAYAMGISYYAVGRYDDAADWFRATLARAPGHARAHNFLGLSLMKLGKSKEALAEYRRALEADPNLSEAHLNLGNAWFGQGRMPEAVAEFREALRLNPKSHAAHNNLAHALLKQGLVSEAAEEFDAAGRDTR